MKQKEMKMVAYVAPDVTIYEIHPEGALCESNNYGEPGKAGSDGSYDDFILLGYFYNDKFYEDNSHTTELAQKENKLYIIALTIQD